MATTKIVKCFAPANAKNTQSDNIDCSYFMDKNKFISEKAKDLERYLDKYRIARVDKLKFANKTFKNKHFNQKKQKHTQKHKPTLKKGKPQ